MEKQAYDPNQTPKKQMLSLQIDLSKFEKATDEEKRQQDVMSESTTFLKDGMRKLRKNKLAIVMFFLLMTIILFAIFGPIFSPYTYKGQSRDVR